ncbi:MAG TPA: hypothetical protein VE824_08165 [Gaiellales bacterium]|nr:hypothetical protein [Gaiellales bacterium]
MDASDVARYALALFLVLTGVGLVYMLVRLGNLFGQATTTLEQTTTEVMPMLGKASITLDHVNDELAKVNHITESAVDATDKLDSTVRTLSSVLGAPAKAVSGASAGVSQAFQSFRSKRNQRGGVV